MSTTDYSSFPERFQLNLVDHQASSSSTKETIASISPVVTDEVLLTHKAGSFPTSRSQITATSSFEQKVTVLNDRFEGILENNTEDIAASNVVTVDESALVDGEEVQSANSSSDEPPLVGKYMCHICDKPFKHPRDLENHIGYHRQEKPYICEICGVSYRQKRGLESHVAIHKGEALFKCDHCNKSFTQKSGLQRHLPIHSGETMFQCDICGKGFMYHSSFAHHKRIHTGERKYSCKFCDQSFMSSSHLKRHIKIHTGEKPHKCDVCQKAFVSNANLKSHRRVHTGIPAHSCPHCDHGFDKKHKMTKHLVDVHPEMACDLDN